jgi:hypothetical protein
MICKVIYLNYVDLESEYNGIPGDFFEVFKVHNNKRKLKQGYSVHKVYYYGTGVKVKKKGFQIITRDNIKCNHLMVILEKTVVKFRGSDYLLPWKENGNYKIYLFKLSRKEKLELHFIGRNGKGGFAKFFIKKGRIIME